ncbi:MAG TPA: ABC transporter permease [Gemmatimonadaceae bacterium]|nr:ABC transporter permease [Gemmatimonadaceae bacterium]
MTLLHRLKSIVRWIARREKVEQDLDDELQAFIDMAAADKVRGGATTAEAHRLAVLQLGGLEQAKEQVRSGRHGAWLDAAARDVSYGLRQVRSNPLFSAIAIATLALGIGGITAMFSAFDAVLIRPLPYTEADQLVMIWDALSKTDISAKGNSTPAEWIEWRRLNTVFTDLASSQPGDATLSGDGDPEQVPARKVTWTFWSVLGTQPMLGRSITEDEDNKGARVVVISYGLWQRRYAGASDIIGRKIALNDEPYEVIGVMPRNFYFMPSREIDIWMPASFPPWMRANFTWHDTQIVARLKPGVTLQHARQSMTSLSLQVTANDFRGPHPVIVTPLREEIAGKTQTALILLLGASVALLLIACVNLTNLLLSRGAARGREVAVRVALGAGRGRLVGQFLTESLVLAALGTLAGLALAVPAMRFLERLVPEAMAGRVTLDWRVLAFSTAVAIAASVTFGLAPALRGSRVMPQEGLRDGGRGTAGARSYWFQHSLIIVETTLAVVLLTCSGLLLQTFQHLRNTDIGFRNERLLTFETPLFRYKDFDRRVAFLNAEVEQVRAIPGVVSAGSINLIPFTNFASATFYLLEGQPSDGFAGQVALVRNVSRDYFATIGAQLREGRLFTAADRRSSAPVAIVNETFANRHFAGRSALGQRFQFGQLNDKGYWYTIVGVLKPIRESGVLDEARPAVYRVHEQCDQIGDINAGIVVRTAVPPASIIPAVRRAIWSLDKNQPLARMRTMQDIVDRQLSTPSQSTALLGAFALLALLLASLGIYGVLSYAVTQRTNEIGVRMALGARSREILLSFGRRGLQFTVCGLAIGLGLAAIASRLMSALLYGFRPAYIPTVAAVSLIFVGVAALACFVPARRASRIDPMIALRQE